jgi:hypothetical protein
MGNGNLKEGDGGPRMNEVASSDQRAGSWSLGFNGMLQILVLGVGVMTCHDMVSVPIQ